MKISIISVGKLKEKYLKQGIEEYIKRLGPYASVDVQEVPDEKAPENLSEAQMLEVKQKEGERILGKIGQDTYVITLEIEGKMITSEKLADQLDQLATYGKSKIAFVIGGSLGISEDVRKRSDFALSFSKLTFPHQMMRLMLLEQVYIYHEDRVEDVEDRAVLQRYALFSLFQSRTDYGRLLVRSSRRLRHTFLQVRVPFDGQECLH